MRRYPTLPDLVITALKATTDGARLAIKNQGEASVVDE